MYKLVLASTAVALGALGWQPKAQQPALLLKEEAMVIEYTPARNEAVLIMEAESEEPLDKIEIANPKDRPILKLRGAQASAWSGYVIETREMSLAGLMQMYHQGEYKIRAITSSGRPAVGGARVDHYLLPAPQVTYPVEGTIGVPTKGLVVTWNVDSEASAYRVILEQDENDGLVVQLPRQSGSFAVPDGILQPGMETQLEIAAIGSNGNITLTEVLFQTQ
jgi:hypothetical protein